VRKKKALNVTLICVAGVEIPKALLAIFRSLIKLDFERIVFVTPSLIPIRVGRFSIERPIGSKLESLIEYNKYVLYKLHHHVKTEHCLLIQADGYVINGSLWSDEFCEYDYIGAPWPIEKERYVDPFGKHQRVGNGGFSLRSRKLLEVPLTVEVPWNVNEGSFYKHFNQNSYSEDGNICVHNRHIFQEKGCRFAPLEIAIKFSRELNLPDAQFGQTLGFHRYKTRKSFLRKIKDLCELCAK
jgi:hypothetical protein